MTDNLSKLSWVFEFESEVLLSRFYERAIRSSFKNSVMRFKKGKESQISQKIVSGSLKRTRSMETDNGDVVDGGETQPKPGPNQLDPDLWSIEAVDGGAAGQSTEWTTLSSPYKNQHFEPAVYHELEAITKSYRPDESTESFTGDIALGGPSTTPWRAVRSSPASGSLEGGDVDSQVVDFYIIYEADAASTQLFELAAEDTEMNTIPASQSVDSKDNFLTNVVSEEVRYFRELQSLTESQLKMSYY